MPYSLALSFYPKYKLKTKAIENNNGFKIQGLEWNATALVRIKETQNHRVKVGFVQVIKSFLLKTDYKKSIVEWKLRSTPMGDYAPAADAPWYEKSSVLIGGIGCSPEITGPCNKILKPEMHDRPTVEFSWTDGANNPVSRSRRKEQFQTWIVVNNQTLDTWKSLYCFAYTIDQVIDVDVTKQVGQRCKVTSGASTQASAPTTYSSAPFPKIPTQAFDTTKCANVSQYYVRTVRK